MVCGRCLVSLKIMQFGRYLALAIPVKENNSRYCITYNKQYVNGML